MTSTTVFDKVATGELSAEQGAEILLKERARESNWAPQQPSWMPRWVYVVCLIVASVFLAPILSNGRRHS